MAKSHNELVLEQADREIGKSINMRVLLANCQDVSEADVKSQALRLTTVASRVNELDNEPKADSMIERLKFELNLLLNVNVESQSKKQEQELVAVG